MPFSETDLTMDFGVNRASIGFADQQTGAYAFD